MTTAERHQLTAEVAAMVRVWIGDHAPGEEDEALKTVIATAAGRLCASIGADRTLLVMSNISAALTGGG